MGTRNVSSNTMHNVFKWFKSWWFTLINWRWGGSKKNRGRTKFQIDWVLTNQVAVGRFPTNDNINELKQAQIQVILSLCPPFECDLSPELKQHFQCHCVPLPDSHYTKKIYLEELHQAVGIIYKAVKHQQPIYVHCREGIERSPTVCIAYLCLVQNMELWRAFNQVKQSRPQISPSHSQVKAIRQYLEASKSRS
jgi:atypical dual specificity phosphatase